MRIGKSILRNVENEEECCGALSDELQAKIKAFSINELESLGEALLDF